MALLINLNYFFRFLASTVNGMVSLCLQLVTALLALAYPALLITLVLV
jgi:hypothetical protein